MRWSCGIVTIPARRDNHFANSLASLRAGGFVLPHVFIDGGNLPYSELEWEGLPCTVHSPPLGVAAGWLLSAWEMYLRCPNADRYALFQDDITCPANLRQYLERTNLPEKTYGNLYCCPSNQETFFKRSTPNRPISGWHVARYTTTPGIQSGRGALGLVFTNEGLRTLLSSQHLITRFYAHAKREEENGNSTLPKNLDGAVVQAMNELGWREVVHFPSLLQHTAPLDSSIARGPRTISNCYVGNGYDALDLLRGRLPEPINRMVQCTGELRVPKQHSSSEDKDGPAKGQLANENSQ